MDFKEFKKQVYRIMREESEKAELLSAYVRLQMYLDYVNKEMNERKNDGV